MRRRCSSRTTSIWYCGPSAREVPLEGIWWRAQVEVSTVVAHAPWSCPSCRAMSGLSLKAVEAAAAGAGREACGGKTLI
eukprot:9471221-Pyramimonas_sp.AAC.1